MMLDQPGIVYLDDPDAADPVPYFALATEENANEIRQQLINIISNVNKYFVELNQPFRLLCPELATMTTEDLCWGSVGRKEYIQHFVRGLSHVIITDTSAKIAVSGIKHYREEIRGQIGGIKPNKTIINYGKGEQAGKTQDNLNRNILLCVGNTLETGIHTVPLIVLTKETEHEETLQQDWSIISGFWQLLTLHCLTNDKKIKFAHAFNNWGDFDNFWLRRSSSKRNLEFFSNKLKKILETKSILSLSVDEADVGLAKNSVLDKWLSTPFCGDITLYDCLTSNHSQFFLSCHSATLNPFTTLRDYAVNITVEEETNYINWKDIPIHTVHGYGTLYSTPEIDRSIFFEWLF